MPDYPAIPEPQLTQESMFESVKAQKEILEHLLDIRGTSETSAATKTDIEALRLDAQKRINLATEDLGTVSSVAVSGGTTGLTTSGGPITTSGTITLAGTLDVDNGGTGQTSYTDGQLLIGNSSGNTLTKAALTAGAGISITNGGGSITIASTSSWTKIDRTADQTISTSTTLVDDNTFQFAVTAGQRYVARGLYSIYSDDVGGFKLAVDGPTLSTGELRVGTTSAAAVAYGTTFSSFGSVGAYVIAFYINYDCATSGTLKLRIAQLNSAGNTTFEAGSWLEYRAL